MAYHATHRFARIAPRKARLVADMIRGLDIDKASIALDMCKRRGAYYLRGVLKSAIANAEQEEADVASLYVAEVRVDCGPTLKRFQPKDRGRAHSIRKRTSHFFVAVAERG
ncbi:MAG TPA: 50S ribosomal protein L22 [Phycisphaerales bacterium]|nr:50S ribosomal protein L22 [Phycisphaerales bacterium]HMP36436.1 50S ribosomal protein L22 [Phycisphaerales bacterium]